MQAAGYVILINLAVLAATLAGFQAAHRRGLTTAALGLLRTGFALILGAAVLAVAISAVDPRVGDLWISRSVVPAMLHVGLVALGLGVLRHYRCRVPRSAIIGLTVIPAAWIGASAGLPMEDVSRISAYSVGGAFAAALPLFILAGRARLDALDRLLLGATLLLALQFALRPVMVAFGITPGVDVATYLDSDYALATLTMQTIAFVLLVGALTLVLLRDGMRLLERRSQRDPLTGLLNRRGLEERSAETVRLANDPRRLGSVVVADLDHFKCVNDRFGHAAGDDAIRAFSDLLRRSAGERDLAARIGGEEFVVVLAGKTPAMARLFAEGVRTAFAQTTLAALDGERLTASLGVAEWRGGERLDDAIARGDAALYEAKRSGRDCVVSHVDAAAEERRAAG